MARALDRAGGAVDGTVVERRAVVGADILDRQVVAVAVDDDHRDAVGVDAPPGAGREFVGGADVVTVGHDRAR